MLSQCRCRWRVRVLLSTSLSSLLLLLGMLYVTGPSLQESCLDACHESLWTEPLAPHHAVYVNHVMTHVIAPHQEHPPRPLTSKEVNHPDWAHLGDWKQIIDLLVPHCRALKTGTFVEIGAGDGEFLSLTSELELLHGWKGLLVEPRVEAFKNIRARRTAAAANVCASVREMNKKDYLWEPRTADLPYDIGRLNGGRTTLLQFVKEEDLVEGDVSVVQCYTLRTLLEGYARFMHARVRPIEVDLLVIDTVIAELEILDGLADSVEVKMLLIRFQQKVDDLLALKITSEMGMHLVPQNRTKNYGFFVHKKIQLTYKTY